MVALLEERALLSTITTVAGNGTAGYTGDGGPATAAELKSPLGIAVDAHGDIFFADFNNDVVREVNAATGKITTFAGNGHIGYSGDGGPATAAELFDPVGIAVDTAGDVFIADEGNNVIREVNASTGTITTVAGNGRLGYSGDGGPATAAEMYVPQNIALDAAGDIFISDLGNNVVREVRAATGVITTVAGNGQVGHIGDGGPATAAEINPGGLAVDASGNNLYIVDLAAEVVRKVDLRSGIITRFAGGGAGGSSGDGGPATAAKLDGPDGVAVDASGDLFIADNSDNVIREVSAATGKISTVAGNGTAGYTGDGGPATSAELNIPQSVAVDAAGDLFIGDTGNYVVREVKAAGVPTPTPTPPATVQNVSLAKVKTGKRTSAEVIVLHFSEALNVGDAQNTGSYNLVTVPKTKKQKSKPVALAQASYNQATFTVTLRTRSPLVLNPPIRLTVKATSLLDSLGRPLNGGANFVELL